MNAGTKAEAAKQKLSDAERHVKGNVNEIQKSRVGQNIPTQIQNVTFYDLLKYTWVAVLSLDLAMVLITEARKMGTEKAKGYVFLFLKVLFLVTGMLADFTSLFIFAAGMLHFFKFLFVTKILKTCVCVFILFLSVEGIFMQLCSVLFGILIASIDLLFIYYLSLYLNRLEQDEYNDYGIPVSDEKV